MAAIPQNNFAVKIDQEAHMFYKPLIISDDIEANEFGSFKGRALSLMTGVYLAASYPYRLAAKVATIVETFFRAIAELILAAVSFGRDGMPMEMFKAFGHTLGVAALSPLTTLVGVIRSVVGALIHPAAAVGTTYV